MPPAARSPAPILRRIAELDSELRQTRDDLKKLRTNDPLTAEVVMRGARLFRERSDLERRLAAMRLVTNHTTDSSFPGAGAT